MNSVKVLSITGMHRSGTSLVSSWMERCGLATNDGDLYGPAAGNLKGHFEDREFVDLHAEALKRMFPRSKGWIAKPNQQLDFTPDLRARARALIEKRNKTYTLWGWKDPRTILFYEEWKRLIPDLKFVCTWRPCLDVLDSLVRRSRASDNAVMKISRPDALKLWVAYNKQIIFLKKCWPKDTLIFSVKELIREDQRVFELIRNTFDMRLTYIPLADLLEPTLFKSSLHTTNIMSLFCRLSEVHSIETELIQLSETVMIHPR
jgi:hypothetical protein